jgi:hypothetical protein
MCSENLIARAEEVNAGGGPFGKPGIPSAHATSRLEATEVARSSRFLHSENAPMAFRGISPPPIFALPLSLASDS